MRAKQYPHIVTANMSFRSQIAVDNFIKGQLRLCEKSNIADLMSTSAKVSKKNNRDIYVKKHLPAIAARLKAITDTPWKFRDASAVIYGLMYLDEDSPGVIDILTAMTPVIHQIARFGYNYVDVEDVPMLFQGLQRITSKKIETLNMISSLVLLLKACKKSSTSREISDTIYGLMMMSSGSAQVRELMVVLGDRLKECKGELSAKDCVSVALGMRNMSCEHIEIREICSTLATKVKSCTGDMSSQNFSNIIACLPEANSDYTEVREQLSAVLLKEKQCIEPFKSKSLSSAVRSMKGMSSDRREVRSLAGSLAAKIRKNDEEWSSLSISMVLIGMQRMTDCPETLELLSAIVVKIRNLKIEMESQQIGDCLYGLQDMTDKSTAIRNVLFALNIELRKCSGIFTPKSICDSLYGLQNMKANSGEVLSVLSILSEKIRIIPKALQFTVIDVSNALYGLQGLYGEGNKIEFMTVLGVLCKRAQLIKEHSDDDGSGNEEGEIITEKNQIEIIESETPSSHLVFLHQSILFFVNEHSNTLDDKRILELKCVANDVINILECRKKKNGGNISLEKEVENNSNLNKITEIASKIYGSIENASILQNGILCNTFDAASILLIPHNEKIITLNIEIDSVSNKKERKKLYRNRRDSYLTANGISIIRIHESKLDEMLGSDIEAWLKKNIADIKNKNK